MGNGEVILIDKEIEYKPTLRNLIYSVFGTIQNEVFEVINFLGYNKDDYILNIYPLTIERVDKQPVPEVLLACIRSKLGKNIIVS